MNVLQDDLPMIDHAGFLEELTEMPDYLVSRGDSKKRSYSCSFCGVGDGAIIETQSTDPRLTSDNSSSTAVVNVTTTTMRDTKPTNGCVKLKISLGNNRPTFPIHIAPTLLDRSTGMRRSLSYEEAVSK